MKTMDGDDWLLHQAVSALARGELPEGIDDEGCDALRASPLHTVPSRQACRKIIYTTKIGWLVSLTDGLDALPADVAVLWRHGPLNVAHREIVRSTVQALGGSLHFIGDLDPLDLVTHATLKAAVDPALAATTYLGVSDDWLELCERDLARCQSRWDHPPTIPLGDDERSGLEGLRRSPAWPGLLGPKALALLDSGVKLELEGASNPNLYSSTFRDNLLTMIFA